MGEKLLIPHPDERRGRDASCGKTERRSQTTGGFSDTEKNLLFRGIGRGRREKKRGIEKERTILQQIRREEESKASPKRTHSKQFRAHGLPSVSLPA